jgi:hypothetical protein
LFSAREFPLLKECERFLVRLELSLHAGINELNAAAGVRGRRS